MAIVLPCSMTPSKFAAAGHEVEMPRPHCPNCSARMSFWGFYSRPLRIGDEIRLLVHRARCSSCRRTHALIPDFVVPGRLDGIEVIGPGINKWQTRPRRWQSRNVPGCLTQQRVVGGDVLYPGRSSWHQGSSPPPSLSATSSHAFPPVWSRSPCVPSRLSAARADAGSGLSVTTGVSPTSSSAGICCRPTPIHRGSAAEGRL